MFAAIVEALCARWIYEMALALALSDTNPLDDNWLEISLYPYKVSPIAIMSQYEHITLMTYLILLGVRSRL